jgi:hypothetical protein
MSVNPISWKQQYVVAVTTGRKTRYFYGETLKEATRASGVKDGQGFAYAKFERGAVQWAEKAKNGKVLICYGPMQRKSA